MFRERMKNIPPEMREKRFRNVGDPRRTDLLKSAYEHGAKSSFEVHGVAAYERAFKMLEDALAQNGGPLNSRFRSHARRHQPDAVRSAARLP